MAGAREAIIELFRPAAHHRDALLARAGELSAFYR
jgi:hypothetical protein